MAAGGVWGIADGANGNGVGQRQARPVYDQANRAARLKDCLPNLPNLTGPVAGSSALAPIYFNLRFRPSCSPQPQSTLLVGFRRLTS
jgi:hypothetical protein